MKRVTLSLTVSIVLVGVIGSIAAMQGPSSPATGPTAGKTVVVVAKGIKLGIHENVRFESIGQHDFIIIPMDPGDTQAKYEVWLSLGEVDMLRVFDAREDAVAYLNAYVNRSTRREALPSLIDESQDASNTQAPRGDVPVKVVKYAVSFIKRYDTNNDGVLTQDEWTKMNQDYSSADLDKDGRITPMEMGAFLSRTDGGSSAPQAVTAEEGTKTLPDAQLVWQECKSESFGGNPQSIHRSKVPGGWLVILKQYPEPGRSITFYPDPQHVWDGTSLD
jgi:hypothetical protein